MAKAVSSANKVTFGQRKGGKASKSTNKNNRKSKIYRGQGR
jgi:hypothetical protein